MLSGYGMDKGSVQFQTITDPNPATSAPAASGWRASGSPAYPSSATRSHPHPAAGSPPASPDGRTSPAPRPSTHSPLMWKILSSPGKASVLPNPIRFSEIKVKLCWRSYPEPFRIIELAPNRQSANHRAKQLTRFFRILYPQLLC